MISSAMSEMRTVMYKVHRADSSTLMIFCAASLCAILPLDISQLMFAIAGAVCYAVLQKKEISTKARVKNLTVEVESPPWRKAGAPRNTVKKYVPPAAKTANEKQLAPRSSEETLSGALRSVLQANSSVKPVVAPSFSSTSWEGEVQELLSEITPTKQAQDIIDKMASLVSATLKPLIPEIELAGFASANLTTGKAFGVACPDVDIVANVVPQKLLKALHDRNGADRAGSSDADERKLQKNALRTCTDRLVAAGFKFRRSNFKGDEPKVTLLAPASLGFSSDPIPIDFHINVVTPLYSAALITECGEIDMRAKDLILIVKRWAKDRGICHAPKGYFSPYVWGILSMYFLQVREAEDGPVLPPLEHFEISSGFPATSRAAVEISVWKPLESTASKKDAAALFKEFVQFFSESFDWHQETASIRTAKRGLASDFKKLPIHIMNQGSSATMVGPSIEDPFNPARNLGECMNVVTFVRLKEELTRAHNLCIRHASLSDLLEPWAPAFAEAGQD